MLIEIYIINDEPVEQSRESTAERGTLINEGDEAFRVMRSGGAPLESLSGARTRATAYTSLGRVSLDLA